MAGFVDDDRHIHDWHEYAGKLLEQRERDKQRVKNWREKTSKGTLRVTNVVDKSRKSKEARGRADKSASAPARSRDPVCWRCAKPINGDNVLDGKCVDSRKGLRHVECAP